MIYAAIGISIFLFSLCLILFWVQGNINNQIRKRLLDQSKDLYSLRTQITAVHDRITTTNLKYLIKLIKLDESTDVTLRSHLLNELEYDLTERIKNAQS